MRAYEEIPSAYEKKFIEKNDLKIRPSAIIGILLVLIGIFVLIVDSSIIEVSFLQTNTIERIIANQPHERHSIICERTVDIAYDDISFNPDDLTKYFLYSPSGGFSNQRSELEYGLLISKILNRTLIIPKAARHTTWWSKYEKLEHKDLVPMDIVFDFSFASNEFDFILSNLTISEIEKNAFDLAKDYPNENNIKLLKPRHRPDWKGKSDILKFLKTEAKLLFLKGSAMYHPWFHNYERNRVTGLLPFNSCLKNIAFEIVKEMYMKSNSNVKHFNALHIRLGDYYKYGRVPSVKKLIQKMNELGFTKEEPIYIATEPKRIVKFFKPLEEEFPNIYYSSDFNEIKNKLKQQFTPEIVNDILGMVEQLVCLLAKEFIGTGYSNFSNYIGIMRNNTKTLFPELESYRKTLNDIKV